jgi:hypothetical protein
VIVRSLASILGDHNAGIEPSPQAPFSRICVHAGEYGTRSSSIIACGGEEGRLSYFHAEGAPCVTSFERIL